MAEVIRMPAVLAGAAEAAIQTWLVAPGSTITLDQTIAEIETDKAIVEYQAESAGIVGRLLAAEGDGVAVGDPIMVIVTEGEGDAEIDAALARASTGTSSAEPSPPGLTEVVPVSGVASGSQGEPAPVQSVAIVAHRAEDAAAAKGQRIFASPLVRRLAAQHGVELADLSGSGPNGRVVRRDLERHLTTLSSDAAPREPMTAPAPPTLAALALPETQDVAAFDDMPLDRMRRAIARRLTESKSTVPHFYLVADCRVDELLALRARVNEVGNVKVSINDFVVKAAAGALIEVPEANVIWNGDSVRRFSSADVSVAVATDGGLSTPVVRGAERLPLTEVSKTIAYLAERARNGRLRQHEIEGGTFSISNLGMYGVAEFTAILNPPQSGILAVGAARKVPVVDAEGQLAVGDVMTVTLSSDHRVIDGAVGARWLAAFQRRIEHPLTILI